MGPERAFLGTLVCAGFLLPALACGRPSSAEDQRRLEDLASRYAGRYELRFEAPVYLRATSLSGAAPAVEDLRDIYGAFWLDANGVPRKDTSYVYLNAYDKNEEWVLQLCWDPKEQRVVESKEREHY